MNMNDATVKRPRDMTESELRALPIGPLQEKEVPLTEEDRANGMVGKSKIVPVQRSVMASYHEPDDIMGAVIDGVTYTFGQFSDGTWFRQPIG